MKAANNLEKGREQNVTLQSGGLVLVFRIENAYLLSLEVCVQPSINLWLYFKRMELDVD